MKIFTALLLFAVILGCTIEVDGFSVDVGITVDPGVNVTFGKGHSHKKKHQARKSEDDDHNSGWPHSNHINRFVRPTSFSDPFPNKADSNDNERSQTQHHRSRHGAYRY